MRKFQVITHNSDWSGEQVEHLSARQFYETYCFNTQNKTLINVGVLLLHCCSNDTLSLVYHDTIAAKRYTICSMID